jgi:hypothetical protein
MISLEPGMSSQVDETHLVQLLNRLASNSQVRLDPSEIKLIALSLVSSSTRSAKSIAYLCLSKLCEGLQKPNEGSHSRADSLIESLRPLLHDWTSEGEPSEFIPATSLLSSLFPLAPSVGVALLTTPTSQTGESDASDALDILLEAAELASPLQPVFAEMLANAAGTKSGRELIRGRAEEWLHGALGFGGDKSLGALCAVALSKLAQEMPEQVDGLRVETPAALPSDELELAEKMMQLIISPPSESSILLTTLEGLTGLSLKPAIKCHLARSQPFLTSLIALAPTTKRRGGSLPVTPRGSMDDPTCLAEPVETGFCYGITAILVNLTSRKPVLSAEDQQIAKLQAMAISGKKGAEPVDDPLDSAEAVLERVKLVLRAGAVGALSGLVRAQSTQVKEALGKLCLNLVEDRGDRPAFVRDGGLTVLSIVVRDLLSATTTTPSQTTNIPSAKEITDVNILLSFQALAKLVITTPPYLLFPPPHLTTCLNALTPIYHLLIHPKSTLLQSFEALMALTNLASIDPSIANRIVEASVTPLVKSEGFLTSNKDDKVSIVEKVEELMLEDNSLVQRAATELVCNLVPSPTGWSHWSGEGDGSTSSPARVAARLNVLLVLTDVDDLPTRLAASGALAIITESRDACRLLLRNATGVGDGKRSAWKRVVAMLEPDEVQHEGEKIAIISSEPISPDLMHRAVVLLLNLVTYTASLEGDERGKEVKSARETGVEARLMAVLKMNTGREVLEPAVEALKMLKHMS